MNGANKSIINHDTHGRYDFASVKVLEQLPCVVAGFQRLCPLGYQIDCIKVSMTLLFAPVEGAAAEETGEKASVVVVKAIFKLVSDGRHLLDGFAIGMVMIILWRRNAVGLECDGIFFIKLLKLVEVIVGTLANI